MHTTFESEGGQGGKVKRKRERVGEDKKRAH